MAVDSSMGRNSNAGDPSAIVAMCRDKAGCLYVEADVERRPVTKIITDGLRFARRVERETGGALDGFGVESDVFQELIADEFWRQTQAAGVALPVYKMFTHGVNKVLRIRRLTPYLSNGNFRWRNTAGTQALVREAREFPVGRTDDALDATEQALRLAAQILNHGGG
jgi:predicted phage terminase large subunit-like protein